MKSPHHTKYCLALVLAACSAQDAGGPSIPLPGRLDISVTGLLDAPAAIIVTGPSDFIRPVTGTTSLSDLPEGDYLIAASNVVVSTFTFVPATPSIVVAVSAGGEAAAVVNYRLASGSASGTWQFSMRASGSTGGCDAGGTLEVVQAESDSAFTAAVRYSGSCPGHHYASSFTIPGTAWGGGIQFQLNPCSYSGAISSTRSDSMGGSVVCTVYTQVGGGPGPCTRCGTYRTDRFGGRWFAVKAAGPVAAQRSGPRTPTSPVRGVLFETATTVPLPGTSRRPPGNRGY
jgi:hypothetical protein